VAAARRAIAGQAAQDFVELAVDAKEPIAELVERGIGQGGAAGRGTEGRKLAREEDIGDTLVIL
jgi:hypothetical protein